MKSAVLQMKEGGEKGASFYHPRGGKEGEGKHFFTGNNPKKVCGAVRKKKERKGGGEKGHVSISCGNLEGRGKKKGGVQAKL